jgi:hypothetical protein
MWRLRVTDYYELQTGRDPREILDSLSYDETTESSALLSDWDPAETAAYVDRIVAQTARQFDAIQALTGKRPRARLSAEILGALVITTWIGAPAFFDRANATEHEVKEVVHSPGRWLRPATTTEGLPVLTAWGRTEQGRPLVVLLRQLRPRVWEILMAAPMGLRQLEEFTAWEEVAREDVAGEDVAGEDTDRPITDDDAPRPTGSSGPTEWGI